MSKEVALIRSTAVISVIIADDNYIDYLSNLNEYDHIVDVTGMSPRPGIGWSYDNGEFFIPEEVIAGEPYIEPTPEQPTE